MNLSKPQTINRSISRDGKSREINGEEKLPPKMPMESELSSSRREFFNAVLPASGKVLTNILRSVGTTLSGLVDDIKTKENTSKKEID